MMIAVCTLLLSIVFRHQLATRLPACPSIAASLRDVPPRVARMRDAAFVTAFAEILESVTNFDQNSYNNTVLL